MFYFKFYGIVISTLHYPWILWVNQSESSKLKKNDINREFKILTTDYEHDQTLHPMDE